jgi:hypothetical protein
MKRRPAKNRGPPQPPDSTRMKYNVGYQLLPDGSFTNAILAARDHVSEIYFSWDDMPNGRGIFTHRNDLQRFEAQARLVADIKAFAGAGIKLNLLLNANCYGRFSLSRTLFEKIGNIIDYIQHTAALHSITTTSPVVAKFTRANFPALEVRASVNMDIGTTQGMDYIIQYFDGYYLRRDLNRDAKAIGKAKKWCDANGKKLYILLNSGCLNHCSARVFHDNLVAHEREIRQMDNAYVFKGVCHDYLQQPARRVSVIRDTSFVRPEDVHLYDRWFETGKLATRINRDPVAVLDAYINRSYSGNILDLLEPDFAETFYPALLENSRFPAGFAETVLHCAKECDNCGYCRNVFEQIKIDLGETNHADQ